jgi:hypothetical protein
MESTNLLVYADWLDENGEPEEAEFRRSMGKWVGKHKVYSEPALPFPYYFQTRHEDAPSHLSNYPNISRNRVGVSLYMHPHSRDREHVTPLLPEGVNGFGWRLGTNLFHLDIPAINNRMPSELYETNNEPHVAVVHPSGDGFSAMWPSFRHMEEAFRKSFFANRKS